MEIGWIYYNTEEVLDLVNYILFNLLSTQTTRKPRIKKYCLRQFVISHD